MGKLGSSRKLGGLLKTGQTTQYGGYADDGYYEKGLSKQYVVLAAGRYAGTTPITVATKTDLISNNCVYDRRTKLMWSRYPSDGLGPAGDGKMPWTTDENGHGIFPFVAAANAAGLGGYSDWRICNPFELLSLLNFESITLVPDSTAFPSFPTTDIHTSATRRNSTTQTFRYVGDPEIIVNVSKATNNYCLLVRGGG